MKSCGKGTGKRKLSVISCSRFLRSAVHLCRFFSIGAAKNNKGNNSRTSIQNKCSAVKLSNNHGGGGIITAASLKENGKENWPPLCFSRSAVHLCCFSFWPLLFISV